MVKAHPDSNRIAHEPAPSGQQKRAVPRFVRVQCVLISLYVSQRFKSNRRLPSKREPGDNSAIARQLNRSDCTCITEARIDPAKPCRCLTLCIALRRCQSICEVGILKTSAVENIAEFGADIHGYALFDAKRSSKGQILYRTALETIVTIVGC